MRDRHWDQLRTATNVQFVIDDTFNLQNLLALKLHEFEDDVSVIVNAVLDALRPLGVAHIDMPLTPQTVWRAIKAAAKAAA